MGGGAGTVIIGRGIPVTGIYHITHIQNLPSIIAEKGLSCDRLIANREMAPLGIAHDGIKERRTCRNVPVASRGTLADYVPFYFAPRSPMLYAIHSHWVIGCKAKQGEILHLVSRVEKVVKSGLSFAFTDGQAVVNISRFFENPVDLNKIDWQIMQDKYWRDTIEDPDRKRRRQAEFLVYQFFPWSLVTDIGVQTRQIANAVDALLQGNPYQPNVLVRPEWYY